MEKSKQKRRIEELKELVQIPSKPLSKDVKIIYDGRQFTIRIPKSFAEKIALDPKKHKFLFMLIPPSDTEKEMKLTAELIKK